ncbi:peroxidase family protein [Bythopirellula goksoeyrii]|uniref:Peroxidase n=1 Tax=Bythopirellula goksoeyrii TaxID=1400387 RepID=A0A5B9Q7N4_9BACT|nr:peroxidase family protein [Bythopirellula goksoeyrii]QEG33750.1 peroxidase [Bythopirellula goksoeyrii]
MKRGTQIRAISSAVLVLSAGFSAAAVEFRTIDGTQNNPIFPAQGAANTRVIRFGYDADYPDDIGDVITEHDKPNPRDVSNLVIAQQATIFNDRNLSDWVVQWGQFITHDMSLIPASTDADLLSTGEVGDFSIPVTALDDPLGPGPISFHRSTFDPSTGNGDKQSTQQGDVPIPRWQINLNTSYLDASHVYGSDSTTAASLRTFVDGKLATSAGGMLPAVNGEGLFLTGDSRANENTTLSATHALFVREHNRLAGLLKARDGTLNDEEIYQWARKIVGAEVQAITYQEFLPALMGSNAPSANDYYYDETVDATITTAFSTAAFRFGHSMQSPKLLLVDSSDVLIDEISLVDATSRNQILQNDPALLGLLLKGLAVQVAQENDAYIVDELRNVSFGPIGAGGTDLAAIDIQRGRDLGLLNSYSLLRIAYNLIPFSQFQQLTSDPTTAAALLASYGTPDNLDAWVAIIAEDHLPESSLGSLAQKIIDSQFQRLRDGDRFFFTGDSDLQDPLVTAIIDFNSITLSRLIELNTGVTGLQENVFFADSRVPEPGSNLLLGSVALVFFTRVNRKFDSTVFRC